MPLSKAKMRELSQKRRDEKRQTYDKPTIEIITLSPPERYGFTDTIEPDEGVVILEDDKPKVRILVNGVYQEVDKPELDAEGNVIPEL